MTGSLATTSPTRFDHDTHIISSDRFEPDTVRVPDSTASGARSAPVELATSAPESRCGFIAGYSILGRIGQGGMGVVYQAIQESLQRVVALKVLIPTRSTDPEFVERFRGEAMAVARLSHPNIVTAYDYGHADGRFYLALEYVEGPNCAELVDQGGPLSEVEAACIAREAALGLSHALRAGIIHRDVKPANLMFVSSGLRDADSRSASGMVKVTDLGLAKVTALAEGRSDRFFLDKIVGTPSFMAPEQAHGEEVDFRADIFALGATLYFLVTGRKPFESPTLHETLQNRLDDVLIAHPEDVVPGLSPEFCLVLDRMMARRPESRFPSYEALLADLDLVAQGRRPTSPRVAPGQSSFLPRKRHWLNTLRDRRERARQSTTLQRVIPVAIPRARIVAWVLTVALGFLTGLWIGLLLGR